MDGIAFFIDMEDVPTSTAQEKGFRVVGKHVMVFDKPKTKQAKEILAWELKRYVPAEPFKGPIRLTAYWYFKNYTRSKKTGRKIKARPAGYRITRPDTDNLNKGLKDVMTKCGFWEDDAQVCEELIGKYWSERPGIFITVEKLSGIPVELTKTIENQTKG